MTTRPSTPPRSDAFELHFTALSGSGAGFSFPCDAAGQVDLDAMSERSRVDYFFARTVIGRHLARPCVQPGIRPRC